MQRRKKNKLDKVEIGLLTGVVVPLILFFGVYLIGDNDISFSKYLKGMWQMQALIKLGSLCVFANSGVFWIFLNKKYEKAARGVVAATFLYAFAVIISRAL